MTINKRRAFAVYECDEGWCIEPLHDQFGTFRTGKERKSIAAFTRLSQAIWWLPRNLDKWSEKDGRKEIQKTEAAPESTKNHEER